MISNNAEISVEYFELVRVFPEIRRIWLIFAEIADFECDWLFISVTSSTVRSPNWSE